MKSTTTRLFSILLIFLFLASQSLTWEIISFFIPETSAFYKTYPAFQIMFAFIYILCCIFFTHDNKNFIKFWKLHPKLYKIFDLLIIVSEYIIEYTIRLAILIPELFSTSSDNTEIRLQKEEMQNNIEKYRNYPLQAKCIFPVCVIILLSIPLFQFGNPTFLHYYSQIMNFLASLIGLAVILCNVTTPTTSA